MLMIGLEGLSLTAAERAALANPALSGVILFARNFADREQLGALVSEIRTSAPSLMLIAVDQEGGPVQRFREGFSRLPELARFGARWHRHRESALVDARTHAWLMASEIRALDIDLSFAPVVDLGRGNRAIGERAFDAEPEVVADFTRAYLAGMHDAGMAATLKHFPGHGSVPEDTHHEDAVDPRPLQRIAAEDLVPFRAGIEAGAEAVMMAHVVYPEVDAQPAGYSPRWIGGLLREQFGFGGVVFSDDIGMAAAFGAGGVAARFHAHLDAGCDIVLACAPELREDALAAVAGRTRDEAVVRRLAGRAAADWTALTADPRWREARARLDIDDRHTA